MSTIHPSENLNQEDLNTPQSNLLENPLTQAAIQRLSKRLSEENTESQTPTAIEKSEQSEPQRASNVEKIKTVTLSALLVSGLGVLAICYPHFLDDFDLSHVRGNDLPSVILMILFFLLVKFAWSQIGGTVAIALSIIMIVIGFWPAQVDQTH